MTKSLMDQALASHTPWRQRWRLVATAKAIMNEARFDSLSEHRQRMELLETRHLKRLIPHPMYQRRALGHEQKGYGP